MLIPTKKSILYNHTHGMFLEYLHSITMFTVFASSAFYTHAEVGARSVNTSTTVQTDVLCVTLIFICKKKESKLKNHYYTICMFDTENPNFETKVLTDFTLDTLPALVTFTVVAPYGVHTGPTIHTHVHVAFIDI